MSGLREKTRAKRTLRFRAWVAGDFLSINLECGWEEEGKGEGGREGRRRRWGGGRERGKGRGERERAGERKGEGEEEGRGRRREGEKALLQLRCSPRRNFSMPQEWPCKKKEKRRKKKKKLSSSPYLPHFQALWSVLGTGQREHRSSNQHLRVWRRGR